MAEQARVTSVEAVAAFRSKLIVYLSQARPTLEEASGELVRTRLWLQNDQRRHWANEIKLRTKKLERAEGELFGARLSPGDQASAAQQMAVRRAREAVHEAEAKLAAVKKWERELENCAEPLVRMVDQLHHYLTSDMARAVAYLEQVLQALEAYAEIAKPGEPRGTQPGSAGSAGEISPTVESQTSADSAQPKERP